MICRPVGGEFRGKYQQTSSRNEPEKLKKLLKHAKTSCSEGRVQLNPFLVEIARSIRWGISWRATPHELRAAVKYICSLGKIDHTKPFCTMRKGWSKRKALQACKVTGSSNSSRTWMPRSPLYNSSSKIKSYRRILSHTQLEISNRLTRRQVFGPAAKKHMQSLKRQIESSETWPASLMSVFPFFRFGVNSTLIMFRTLCFMYPTEARDSPYSEAPVVRVANQFISSC